MYNAFSKLYIIWNLFKINESNSITISFSIVILSIGIITSFVFAQQISSLDLTTSTVIDLYGGDKKGTVIENATMNKPPTEGQVYEGWFEDKWQASGYSLRVGEYMFD